MDSWTPLMATLKLQVINVVTDVMVHP